jgi:protein-disulfide isomerase
MPDIVVDPKRSETAFSQLSAGAHRLGPARTEVRIVVFADYTCGHCAVLQGSIREIRRRYPDNVSIYHQLLFQGDRASPSYLLAHGAECAAQAGVFEAYHNAAYEARRSVINRDEIARLAGSAGLGDSAAFEACMDDDTFGDKLLSIRSLGKRLDLPGTPASSINGRWLIGSLTVDELDRLVVSILRPPS